MAETTGRRKLRRPSAEAQPPPAAAPVSAPQDSGPVEVPSKSINTPVPPPRPNRKVCGSGVKLNPYLGILLYCVFQLLIYCYCYYHCSWHVLVGAPNHLLHPA